MANEIYNTTWWGTAIDTSTLAGTDPDFFGSQFKLETRNPVEAKKCVADWIHRTALQDLNN